VTSNPTALERRDPPPPPRHTTQVESSRAVAEVAAMVRIAQDNPRDLDRARRQMLASCDQYPMAERAFFSYRRGGSVISGPSVHLARELARCFGNITYGVSEIDRDDVLGRSEILAWAWDVESNTREAITFVVPHQRDAGGERKPLAEIRDVYENNANQGARRLREALLDLLPPWFVEEAKGRATATLERGDSAEPFDMRRAKAATWFAEVAGVTRAQLEDKLGRAFADWTPVDLAQLTVLRTSLQRREITRDEAFPPAGGERVTRDELAGRPNGSGGDAPADPAKASPEQLRAIGALFTALGVGGMSQTHKRRQLEAAQTLADDTDGLSDLTALAPAQADQVIRGLTAATEDDAARSVLGLDDRDKR
jgi:hypothetical protein